MPKENLCTITKMHEMKFMFIGCIVLSHDTGINGHGIRFDLSFVTSIEDFLAIYQDADNKLAEDHAQ